MIRAAFASFLAWIGLIRPRPVEPDQRIYRTTVTRITRAPR